MKIPLQALKESKQSFNDRGGGLDLNFLIFRTIPSKRKKTGFG